MVYTLKNYNLMAILGYSDICGSKEVDSDLNRDWRRLAARLRAVSKEDPCASVPDDLLKEIVAFLHLWGSERAAGVPKDVNQREYQYAKGLIEKAKTEDLFGAGGI